MKHPQPGFGSYMFSSNFIMLAITGCLTQTFNEGILPNDSIWELDPYVEKQYVLVGLISARSICVLCMCLVCIRTVCVTIDTHTRNNTTSWVVKDLPRDKDRTRKVCNGGVAQGHAFLMGRSILVKVDNNTNSNRLSKTTLPFLLGLLPSFACHFTVVAIMLYAKSCYRGPFYY